MADCSQQAFLSGCKAVVPLELAAERLCVSHFVSSIEDACAGMRRELTLGGATVERRLEITNYVRITAVKLSESSTGSSRLSDELKKRVLTTFLTLMNLRESVDRAATNRLAELGRLRSPVQTASFQPIVVA